MPWLCDLHTHSTVSDGTLTPAELVRRARRSGVKVLALTDHDDVAGIEEARASAEELDLELLPGIELSVSEEGGARQASRDEGIRRPPHAAGPGGSTLGQRHGDPL